MIKCENRPTRLVGCLLLAVVMISAAKADNPAGLPGADSLAAPPARFGLFDWLDHRSAYYAEFSPQPLLVDDTGLESDGELEFSSLSTQAGGQRADSYAVGVQKSFGLLTLELSVPYQKMSDADDNSEGVGSISLAARYPLYQFVSGKKFFDTTFGVALEAGLPANSPVSQNAELTPKIFNDLKLGEHFSLQTILGYSTLLGGGDKGDLQTFEYGFDFACALPHRKLPLPGVEQFTPMLEVSGETELNHAAAGQNSLLGCIGFRVNFKPLGDVQPSLGLGYVFPIDVGAHTEVRWGIATSLTFDF